MKPSLTTLAGHGAGFTSIVPLGDAPFKAIMRYFGTGLPRGH
jgi:hypothetical protein